MDSSPVLKLLGQWLDPLTPCTNLEPRVSLALCQRLVATADPEPEKLWARDCPITGATAKIPHRSYPTGYFQDAVAPMVENLCRISDIGATPIHTTISHALTPMPFGTAQLGTAFESTVALG